MKLSSEVKDVMSKVRIYPVATASKDGVPNVVPIGFVIPRDDETIWIIDNFMDKSLKNVKENPVIALYAWDPDSPNSYQIKCSVKVANSGPEYEEAVKIAHSKKETYPAKNLFILKVTDVFYVTTGPNAGKKL